MKSSARRLLLTLASIAPLAIVGSSATAQAATVDTSLCNGAPLTQPFAQWGDTSAYELAPGGDFESNTWTLSGAAQIIGESEPFAATGSVGAGSLSVPAGSSATSPLTCLNASYPTLRMFVGGTGLALVSIVYNGVTIPIGAVHAGGSWEPSSIINTNGAIFGLLSGGTGNVSIRLTGLSGSPVVDDVFIDPWQRT
jgi:hypothetical protein